jgi:hypothetical protein
MLIDQRGQFPYLDVFVPKPVLEPSEVAEGNKLGFTGAESRSVADRLPRKPPSANADAPSRKVVSPTSDQMVPDLPRAKAPPETKSLWVVVPAPQQGPPQPALPKLPHESDPLFVHVPQAQVELTAELQPVAE